MERKNHIKEIIRKKIGLKPMADKELLERLGMTANRFNQIIFNKGNDMTVIESKAFAEWLDVNEEELFQEYYQEKKTELAERLGLSA